MKSNLKLNRLKANLLLAESILRAIDLRKESRGSHYPSDYPNLDNNMSKKIIIHLNKNINVNFE